MQAVQRIIWIIFIILCILVGIYPALYSVMPEDQGLLSTKSAELLASTFWRVQFYTHISFGGLALLIGWVQFSKKIREKNITLHRNIGKVYVLSVILSGISGLYIGYYATGGIISASGFMLLALLWLYTTSMSYLSIRRFDILKHQKLMIFSYALCFAAVSLRIQLPILTTIFQDFLPAYKIVSWSCWVPNLIVAYMISKRVNKTELQT